MMGEMKVLLKWQVPTSPVLIKVRRAFLKLTTSASQEIDEFRKSTLFRFLFFMIHIFSIGQLLTARGILMSRVILQPRRGHRIGGALLLLL